MPRDIDPTNPLLLPSPVANGAPPFDQIAFAHFEPALEATMEEARERVAAIRDNEAVPSFENTIAALEDAANPLDRVAGIFFNLLSAESSDEMQELAQKMGPKLSDFGNDIILDQALYARVKAVWEQRDKLNLTTEQATLLEETHTSFVRGGADLNDADKARKREIDARLAQLSNKFSDNDRKANKAYLMVIDDQNRLTGLPESAKKAAAAVAEEKGHAGKWAFTLDIPSYLPFMQYAEDRALREELWRARSRTALGGEFDNTEIVKETVRLRDEAAKLLGYSTYAEMVLERRMAKNPATVDAFLDRVKNVSKPAAEAEMAELQQFARDNGGPEKLEPWDSAFYTEKLRKARFDLDDEALRPYFPVDKVINGAFEVASRLFDIRFEQAPQYPVYHDDVTAYEVYDNKDDSLVGVFYTDFFPRDGKRGGAWMTTYRDAGTFDGKSEVPLVSIVCNFTKPVGDEPALLTHDEVLTLFHEFGHSLHGLLAEGEHHSLTGTNVYWDFVELPSQLMENWCYEKEALDLFAQHYKTGESIPSELVEKLQQSRTFMAGSASLRQTSLASIDMAWHNRPEATQAEDVEAYEEAATRDLRLLDRRGAVMSTGFGHLFSGGYAAGYYSYKWAEVLDADAFEAFKEADIFDKGTAARFRDNVLSKGGTEKPDVLYKRFRGRDPDPDALFRRDGLLPPKDGGAGRNASSRPRMSMASASSTAAHPI